MEEKKLLRKRILKLRNSMPGEDICRKSKLIIGKLCDMPEFAQSRLIMSYVNFGSEVETILFIDQCLKMGKRVAVPVIAAPYGCKSEIVASEIHATSEFSVRNSFGVPEPDKMSLRIVPPDEIELSVIPGIAFDIQRQRLGYGCGFYDRFLKRTSSGCCKAGIAFELQLLDRIPAEEHDVALDMVITEERIL